MLWAIREPSFKAATCISWYKITDKKSHTTSFGVPIMRFSVVEKQEGRDTLFNDALNTFYYIDVGHMVKNHRLWDWKPAATTPYPIMVILVSDIMVKNHTDCETVNRLWDCKQTVRLETDCETGNRLWDCKQTVRLETCCHLSICHYGYIDVRHMVKNHIDCETGNLLPPLSVLLFSTDSKDRITRMTDFGILVMGHWLEWERSPMIGLTRYGRKRKEKFYLTTDSTHFSVLLLLDILFNIRTITEQKPTDTTSWAARFHNSKAFSPVDRVLARGA